jgi:hypothetical protein
MDLFQENPNCNLVPKIGSGLLMTISKLLFLFLCLHQLSLLAVCLCH